MDGDILMENRESKTLDEKKIIDIATVKSDKVLRQRGIELDEKWPKR